VFRLGQYSLDNIRIFSLATVLKSIFDIERPEFVVIVPVFSITDAWKAAKIANAKAHLNNAKLVSCVPFRNDYICIFSSSTKPQTNFPVYKASSERGARKSS